MADFFKLTNLDCDKDVYKVRYYTVENKLRRCFLMDKRCDGDTSRLIFGAFVRQFLVTYCFDSQLGVALHILRGSWEECNVVQLVWKNDIMIWLEKNIYFYITNSVKSHKHNYNSNKYIWNMMGVNQGYLVSSDSAEKRCWEPRHIPGHWSVSSYNQLVILPMLMYSIGQTAVESNILGLIITIFKRCFVLSNWKAVLQKFRLNLRRMSLYSIFNRTKTDVWL